MKPSIRPQADTGCGPSSSLKCLLKRLKSASAQFTGSITCLIAGRLSRSAAACMKPPTICQKREVSGDRKATLVGVRRSALAGKAKEQKEQKEQKDTV